MSLRGITRIEEAFVLVLALAAITLYVGLGLAERRRELATMSALGTSLARIGGFIYTEAAIILAAAYAFSALLGLLLAEMLIAMLQHVFDPPPDHISVPWRFLLELAAVTVAGWLLAAAVATLRIRRLPVGVILREE